MENEVQKFLIEELLRHAETHGFAFLIEEGELLRRVRERFDLSRSEALWEMTVFIQENGGPQGDLAVVERNGRRHFQWRFVEWPSWLPKYIKKPKWHRAPPKEGYSVDY